MLFIQIKMMIVSIMLNKIVVPLLFVLPTFANCLQFKSFNIWRLFISLPFYLVSSSSLSSSTLEGRLCMCLQLYFIFLWRSPTSSQPSLSFNDFVLVLCGRWFLFFQLFHVSVEIHIFITIIINSYGLFVILQFYLIFLLWSPSSSPSSSTLAEVCKSIWMFCCDPHHFQYLANCLFVGISYFCCRQYHYHNQQ